MSSSWPCLFIPQIDNEEYGEALSLAHAYNLDSDLVYQRQWRKSTVSIASIQDYLVRDKRNKRDRFQEMRKGRTREKRLGSDLRCLSQYIRRLVRNTVCVCGRVGVRHTLKCSKAPLLYFTHHFYQFVANFHTLPS